MKTTICSTCPWRVGATAEAIPNFDVCKARNLRNTVGDGDDFRTIMACHSSTEDNERPCGGYLVVEGWSNLAVRMNVITGKWEMPEVEDHDVLVGSFEEMLEQVDDEYEPEGAWP